MVTEKISNVEIEKLEDYKFCLKDGKAYYNRRGEVIEVRLVKDTDKYQFERSNGPPELYMKDGRYSDSYGVPVNELDLVREVVTVL